MEGMKERGNEKRGKGKSNELTGLELAPETRSQNAAHFQGNGVQRMPGIKFIRMKNSKQHWRAQRSKQLEKEHTSESSYEQSP
jgi:hypothetical protein